jgi:hypothetical protein
MRVNGSFVRVALGALLALSVTATAALAQQSSDQTSAGASATIVAAISIVKNVDLNFGAVVPDGAAPGTVVLTPAASPVRTPTTLKLGNPTGVAAARFTVTGEAGSDYTVTLPASAVITNGTPADDMTIDNFTSSPSGGAGHLTVTTQTVYVGGTLNVAAAQPAGIYTGTFNVTVSYN